MTIGERIKQARINKGLTQEEFAKLIGYSDKSTIAKIESSDRGISSDKLFTIANALGVSPTDLLGWDDSFTAHKKEYEKLVYDIRIAKTEADEISLLLEAAQSEYDKLPLEVIYACRNEEMKKRITAYAAKLLFEEKKGDKDE